MDYDSFHFWAISNFTMNISHEEVAFNIPKTLLKLWFTHWLKIERRPVDENDLSTWKIDRLYFHNVDVLVLVNLGNLIHFENNIKKQMKLEHSVGVLIF